ncbi:hypothetical protein [Streptomyces sp. NBC_00649]|uniref:hypothetical protein n=1 Tax=Streptomyces sp. NBC_00649 TaxID=2975798 RepID=UPI003254CECA
MRMRAHQVTGAAGLSFSVVGAGLIAHSAAADNVATWRTGLAALIIGLIALIDARSTRNRERLLAHQVKVAELTVRERWRYAEMGWKAARLDALEGKTEEPDAADAQVYALPAACPRPEARSGGSAL